MNSLVMTGRPSPCFSSTCCPSSYVSRRPWLTHQAGHRRDRLCTALCICNNLALAITQARQQLPLCREGSQPGWRWSSPRSAPPSPRSPTWSWYLASVGAQQRGASTRQMLFPCFISQHHRQLVDLSLTAWVEYLSNVRRPGALCRVDD